MPAGEREWARSRFFNKIKGREAYNRSHNNFNTSDHKAGLTELLFRMCAQEFNVFSFLFLYWRTGGLNRCFLGS
jgi:hypothetical protein